MGISLNYTTIHNCDSTDGFTAIGDASNIATSDYPPKEGDKCLEFECKPNSEGGYKTDCDPFDCREFEVGIWFLNPYVDSNNNKMLADNDESAVRIRLYSGNNWADFYQKQHIQPNGEWKGGWMYLRASGEPGDEDANSGTWTENEVANIDGVAIYVKTSDGDTTDKNSAKFGIDWFLRYNAITITGDNDGNPWNLEDIYNFAIDKSSGGGVWGIVNKAVDFYEINASLILGDGNAGSFQMQNEYLLLSQWSKIQKQNIIIKNNFSFIVGTLDKGTINYAKNGCVINADGLPQIIIENGGIFKIYQSKIQGFDTIIVGDGTNNNTDDIYIELIKTSLFNNNNVDINYYETNLENNKFYSDKNEGVNNLTIKVPIKKLQKLTIFNSKNGLELLTDLTIKEYKALNNTFDLSVKENKNIYLINSEFDSSKLQRIE